MWRLTALSGCAREVAGNGGIDEKLVLPMKREVFLLSEREIDALFHGLPRDDGWRQVTLRQPLRFGARIECHCRVCGFRKMFWPLVFAEHHGVSLDEPLRSMERRMRCSVCGVRAVEIRDEHTRYRPESKDVRREVFAMREDVHVAVGEDADGWVWMVYRGPVLVRRRVTENQARRVLEVAERTDRAWRRERVLRCVGGYGLGGEDFVTPCVAIIEGGR